MQPSKQDSMKCKREHKTIPLLVLPFLVKWRLSKVCIWSVLKTNSVYLWSPKFRKVPV